MKRVACIVLLSCLAATTVARAQPPATMSYQGVLTDGSGNLVPDGPYDLTFRLYTVASTGTAIWTETHLAVPVVRGGFNVILGGTSPLALPFDVPYWLGVTIGAGSELSPRTALAASPYTIAPRFPIETEIDYALGTSAAPGGNPYALLQTLGSFTKAFAFTDIELSWDGHSATTSVGSTASAITRSALTAIPPVRAWGARSSTRPPTPRGSRPSPRPRSSMAWPPEAIP